MHKQSRHIGFLIAAVVAISARAASASTADNQYALAAQSYEQARETDDPDSWRLAIDRLQRFLDDFGQHSRAGEASFFLAEALHKAGKFQAAQTQYQAFLANFGQSLPRYESWASFRIGECAYLAGDFQRSAMALQAFVRQFSEHELLPNALTYLGNISLKQGQASTAADFFQQTLDHLSQLKTAGQTFGRLENEAVLGLARALELQGDQPSARQLYAQLHHDQSGWLADQALYNAALLEYRADDLPAAEQLLVALEERYPQSGIRIKALYLLGLTRLAQQQYSAAAETLRRADPDDPKHALAPDITYHTGEAYRRAGDAAMARTYLQRVTTTWSNSSWADDSLYAQMQLAFDSDDHGTLDQLSQQLAARYSDSPLRREARRLLVRSLLKQEKYEELSADDDANDPSIAAAALARAQALERDDKSESALQLYGLIFKRWPHSDQLATAVLGAARLHRKLGHADRAAEVLAQFVQEHAQHQDLDAALYQWAEVLDSMGQHALANSQLTRLHDELPDSRYWASATYDLAKTAANAQDQTRAVELLDELIATSAPPTITRRAMYLKGQISAAQGDWDAVMTSMQGLTSASSNDSLQVIAEYWMAEAGYRLKNYTDAQQRLNKLAEITAGDQASWLAMIPLRQSQILARQGQWSEALEVASTISDRFPAFGQQYEVDYLLGRCLASLGRFSEARAAYQRVTTSPHGGNTETAAMAQWMIGETYFHQQDYHQATPAYLRVEILHDFPHWQAAALLQAGKCYEKQLDHKAAIQLYARLIKQYPDTSFREEASRRLRLARGKLPATAAFL